jgi:hypothetical protein
MQVAHRQRLQTSPLIDLRLHCTVVDASLDQGGRIEHLVVCTPDGDAARVPVRCVVLAMGGLETTRFMLAMQRRQPQLFGGPEGLLGRFYMAHVIGEVADVEFHNDETDRAFDFFLDGRGSFARRRFIPSDDEQRHRELTNVSFWPVVPPVADARHGSALLSAVFLAMSFGPVGRLLMAEAIRRYHAPVGVARGPHVSQRSARLAVCHSRQHAFLLPALPEPLANSRLLSSAIRAALMGFPTTRSTCLSADSRVVLSRGMRPLRHASPAGRSALRHAGCEGLVPRTRTDAGVACKAQWHGHAALPAACRRNPAGHSCGMRSMAPIRSAPFAWVAIGARASWTGICAAST